jgi:hypothetical protein
MPFISNPNLLSYSYTVKLNPDFKPNRDSEANISYYYSEEERDNSVLSFTPFKKLDKEAILGSD